MRRIMGMTFGVVLVGVLLAGCAEKAPGGSQAAKAAEHSGPIKVTATTGMVGDIARNVGGARVEVTVLMGPGVDPHLYKANQGDLEAFSSSDIILYSGLHLEGRLTDILVKIAQRTQTVAVSETIPKEMLREPPEFEGNYDPHVWFDVSLWKYAAERTRDALIEFAPAHKAEFEANAAAYLKTLDELHQYAKAQLAALPQEQRVLVTAHDAFGYFGKAYGLEVMGLQGISTAAEFGLQDIERLVNALVARKVKAVFVESSVPTKSVQALVEGAKAKGHDVKLGGELYSDAMGAEGTPEGTYIGMVRHNVDTIAGALK